MLESQYLLMVTLLKKVVFSIKEQFHLEKEQFGAENMRIASPKADVLKAVIHCPLASCL